ncbi:Protein abhd16a [Desmophyllum pertusum]|uniref:Protein abhd16a n=1 Tax=Desmophyllum pertusum TaxID=174260 RepID=A0A9W9ZB81_9CNID|nr:Protein abhd16a [Desmophyllum pertusum]
MLFEKLGFPVTKIVIYAWSIGGYPAVWASRVHPQIGGMVLDATFDDIVPLAQTKMPEAIKWFYNKGCKGIFSSRHCSSVVQLPRSSAAYSGG